MVYEGGVFAGVEGGLAVGAAVGAVVVRRGVRLLQDRAPIELDGAAVVDTVALGDDEGVILENGGGDGGGEEQHKEPRVLDMCILLSEIRKYCFENDKEAWLTTKKVEMSQTDSTGVPKTTLR